jgi:hypothetical protein
MAVSEKTLQERLGFAYANYLGRLTTTNRRDIPAEILDDFLELEKAMSREEIRFDEGLEGALARTMGEMEARQHIETIMGMYDKVAKRDPMAEYHPKKDSDKGESL